SGCGRRRTEQSSAECDLAATRELDRVREQPRYQRLERPAVDDHPVEAARQIDDERHSLLRELRFDAAREISEEIREVDARALGGDHADFGLREIEHALHEV